MYNPTLFLCCFSLLISGINIELQGQDGDADDIQQKLQRAITNVLDDELQGDFSALLDELAGRIDNELNVLLDDDQVKELAAAIEKGDFRGVIKQLNIEPSYSVGLHLRKVEEDGQQQIKVVEVVKGSPAEKAGMKKGDTVRAVNDREVDSINSLVNTIKRSGGRELKFRVVRDAMSEIVRIKPAMQIAGMPIGASEAKQVEMLMGALQGELPRLGALGELADMKEVENLLGALMGELDKPQVKKARPAAPAKPPKPAPRTPRSLDELPDNVSLTIQKSGDQPAKITVSRDDEVWEITENEIDELPFKLRAHVRRALGIPHDARKPAEKKADELEQLQQQLKRLKAEMEAIERAIERK